MPLVIVNNAEDFYFMIKYMYISNLYITFLDITLCFLFQSHLKKKTFCQRNLFPWFRERIKITLCVRTHVPIHKLQKFSLLHIHVHVHWCGTQQQVVSLPEINKDISWSDVNKDISRIYPMTVIVKFLYTCICIYINGIKCMQCTIGAFMKT